ncbi:VIT1/CCC1 transporter family protein [Sulfurihydrogenibium sp.]|uniref:VIT1/CCC1 transporter family protein n=1 Tax=Sulfurihydrogenibium sp. TaxID=2053621 RepID=UPI00261A91B3|nr:VIT1/CCC1 transporter family protein [Sulfurihydrogenibium sp.]
MDLIEKAKEFYISEISDYNFYSYLANITKNQHLKENLIKIAKAEEKHSKFWRYFITSRGYELPRLEKDFTKNKFWQFVAKVFNPIVLISILEQGESNALKDYYTFLKEAQLNEYESTALKNIILDEIEHETFFSKEAEKLGLTNVRDLILGMNDGLVEILGTVAGLAAVYPNNPFLVGISGCVVGVAGSLSMGVGAYISVRSQRQINEAFNERTSIIMDIFPEKSYDLFKDKLKENQIPDKVIEEITEKLKRENVNLSNIFIKEVEENEIKSGLFTGFSYLIGVIFPVLPFFISNSSYIALPVSLILAFVILSLVASFVAIFSGISIKKKIMEMVVAASVAAGISFTFGKIVQYFFGIEV